MAGPSDSTRRQEAVNFEATQGAPLPEDRVDELFFTAAFAGFGVPDELLVSWDARAADVGAHRLNAERGLNLMQTLWAQNKYMNFLDPRDIESLSRFFSFATIDANRDIIHQDEYGNFMVVLLSGNIAVDRIQPWGERLRLAETWPGEILGEMSLLDSGIRFSTCTTMDVCEIAVLDARRMDAMMMAAPKLAANLIALLARKLSLRLRTVSARLSDTRNTGGSAADAAKPGETKPSIQGSE
jgi:CRP/FNR family cyclic AMP-dependent transcriptional regulator